MIKSILITLVLIMFLPGCNNGKSKLGDEDIIDTVDNEDIVDNEDTDTEDIVDEADTETQDDSDQSDEESDLSDTSDESEVSDEESDQFDEDSDQSDESEMSDETVDETPDEVADEAPDEDTAWVIDCTDDECVVPAGPFMMGCNEALDSECNPSEFPYHEVTLSQFKIDKYEVTAAQYQACVDNGACNNDNESEPQYEGYSDSIYCNMGKPGRDNYPMNCVSWFGAKAYCEWVGKRLPTEAEWEKAARGPDGRVYPWGNETATCDYAVTTDESNVYGCGTDSTLPVGSKPLGASPYGALDMAGNISEWCNDWFHVSYYSISPSDDPQGPDTGTRKVIRGEDWQSYSDGLRVSKRKLNHPGTRQQIWGFRCAR